jgi:hypothetical protein
VALVLPNAVGAGGTKGALEDMEHTDGVTMEPQWRRHGVDTLDAADFNRAVRRTGQGCFAPGTTRRRGGSPPAGKTVQNLGGELSQQMIATVIVPLSLRSAD